MIGNMILFGRFSGNFKIQIASDVKKVSFAYYRHLLFLQEGITIAEDGSEETLLVLEPNSSFGEISILCNIPQPYTVRVCDLCRLLRLDKQLFANIMEIYFMDGRTVLSNLIKVKFSF